MLIRTLVGCYYNKITTVCACKPTHTFSYAHTHAHARSRTHIFSSVGLHFLIHTHTRAHTRTLTTSRAHAHAQANHRQWLRDAHKLTSTHALTWQLRPRASKPSPPSHVTRTSTRTRTHMQGHKQTRTHRSQS